MKNRISKIAFLKIPFSFSKSFSKFQKSFSEIFENSCSPHLSLCAQILSAATLNVIFIDFFWTPAPHPMLHTFSLVKCAVSLRGNWFFMIPRTPIQCWKRDWMRNMMKWTKFLPCNCSYKNDLWRFHGIVSTLSSSDKLLHVKHVAWPLDAQWRLLWNVSFLEVKLANSINIGWGCGGEWIRWLWTI